MTYSMPYYMLLVNLGATLGGLLRKGDRDTLVESLRAGGDLSRGYIVELRDELTKVLAESADAAAAPTPLAALANLHGVCQSLDDAVIDYRPNRPEYAVAMKGAADALAAVGRS